MPALASDAIAQFLDLGYVIIPLPDVDESIHDQIYTSCEQAFTGLSHMRNSALGFNLIADNINTTIPQLDPVLNAPQLNDALTTLLGTSYYRYNHSFIHRATNNDQGFHKDSGLPWGTRNGIRSHHPNWAMVFYYPQETTFEMGATEVLPGTQYWSVDRENTNSEAGEDRLDLTFESEGMNSHPDFAQRDAWLSSNIANFDRRVRPLRLEVPKGSVVIVHFDLFHRGARHTGGKDRFMLKFWYLRTHEPEPQESVASHLYRCEDERREPIVRACLDWLNIPSIEIHQSPSAPDDSQPSQEADEVQLAYEMAERQDVALLAQFTSADETKRRAATQALTSLGIFGLKSALTNINSSSASVRLSSVFLLGEIAPLNAEVLDSICHLARDDSNLDIRITSINALGRLLRRNNEPSQTDFQQVAAVLLKVIQDAKTGSGRRLIQLSAERQAAYIAILSIVTALSFDTYQEEFNSLAQVICTEVFTEGDRYAKGTAVEIICRLATAGNSIAARCAVSLLRRERVNSFV